MSVVTGGAYLSEKNSYTSNMSCLHHRGLQTLQTPLGSLRQYVQKSAQTEVCARVQNPKIKNEYVGFIGGKFALII